MQYLKVTLILVAVAGLTSLHAGIVFTDFQGSVCCTQNLNGTSPPQSLAGQFIPGANYTMTDAQVKVEENGTLVPTFNLSLYSDNSGAPGASLGSIGGGSAPGGSFGTVMVSSPAFSLMTGTPYWLVMTPNAGTGVFWAGGGSPSSATDSAPNATGGAPWSPVSTVSLQFQIDGVNAPVPEPGSLMLLLPALGLALMRWSSRRRAGLSL